MAEDPCPLYHVSTCQMPPAGFSPSAEGQYPSLSLSTTACHQLEGRYPPRHSRRYPHSCPSYMLPSHLLPPHLLQPYSEGHITDQEHRPP